MIVNIWFIFWVWPLTQTKGVAADPKNQLFRRAPPNAAGKFDGGYLPWSTIQSQYLASSSLKRTFDDKTMTPYLTTNAPSGGFFLAYEDQKSLNAKVKYAAEKGLGGIMVWFDLIVSS